jgi:hypothetical protein
MASSDQETSASKQLALHECCSRFDSGPARFHVFAYDELKLADQRYFEGGDANFAIALGGMIQPAVARFHRPLPMSP